MQQGFAQKKKKKYDPVVKIKYKYFFKVICENKKHFFARDL